MPVNWLVTKFLYPQYTYPGGGYFASISDMANWAAGLDKEYIIPIWILQMNWHTAVKKLGDKTAEFSKSRLGFGKRRKIYFMEDIAAVRDLEIF